MFTQEPSSREYDKESDHPKKEASELVQVYERINKLNIEYAGILYEVEEKLHSIKNLRSQEKSIQDGIDKGGSGNNDFISTIHQQLELFSAYNSRLQKVLKHCSSII